MPVETEPQITSLPGSGPDGRPGSRPDSRPRIAIIGGTGLYALPGADIVDVREIPTPFGAPSSPITLARLTTPADPTRTSLGWRARADGKPGADTAGKPGTDTVLVAFLSRHGRGHRLPPQQINYRANLWALKSLGVEAVISSAAVGGLVPSHRTDSFAVPDQFLDRTWGRPDTFYDGSLPTGVQHVGAAEPFCPSLRRLLATALAEHGEDYLPTAAVAVINGPRFSTKAESAALVLAGAHIVSMTQYPEPVLAAELNMGFASLAYITDADTGHDGSEAVTAELVFARLAAAQPRILAVLGSVVRLIETGVPYRAAAGISASAVGAVMAAPVKGPSSDGGPADGPADAAPAGVLR
ncbi:MTAP family purine nucleoside phosphorylase [Paenarthrobacter sp. Z7-10]|uniref:MTAP family purine nucleoside phosphorylase n=1 Tax=Paenarthrobacter sp. Z7-10 TaxID=2787635 RepID=UPI0022A8D87C|nr:MTAP family purine nucleoside phosphorylase [Paenarthrobacter sp. Z7-10]MCZ2403582.1 MTAP family purine nucleoside phosphorylase [Paenarthrobacter sp. Z7-10]